MSLSRLPRADEAWPLLEEVVWPLAAFPGSRLEIAALAIAIAVALAAAPSAAAAPDQSSPRRPASARLKPICLLPSQINLREETKTADENRVLCEPPFQSAHNICERGPTPGVCSLVLGTRRNNSYGSSWLQEEQSALTEQRDVRLR